MTNALTVHNNHRISRYSRKGFTLIELIVVIAILAILAAIAIPAFTGQLTRAKTRADEATVSVLKSSARVAVAENGSPSPAVTWNKTSDGTGVWAKAGYIDGTWPVPQGGGTDFQVVISTAGAVTVTILTT